MFCPKCGAQNPPEVSHCSACGASLPKAETAVPAGPVTAPVATISRDIYVGKYRLAGLGDRFLALFLDTILELAVIAFLFSWASSRWGTVTPQGSSLEGTRALLTYGVVFAFSFAYFWVLEGLLGSTLGKAVAGIQVRRKDASACTFAASLIRNVARLVDGIAAYLVGFVVAIVSRLRQRLGDHLAGTVVVQREWGRALRSAAFLLWLVVVGASLWQTYLIYRAAPAAGGAGTSAPATSTAPGSSLSSGAYTMVNFAFTEGTQGPARAASPYKPGDQVYARYELKGAARGPLNQVNVGFLITITDPSGIPVGTLTTNVNQAGTDPAAPVEGNFHLLLPPWSPAGAYKVSIKVHDAVSNRDAEFSPGFTVEAPAIAPATRLEVRNFAFATAKDGPALSPAVYQPGQTVYYRFQVFGLQFKDDKVSLHIAFKLLGPNGDVLLDRPDWDATEDTYAYHPPTFNLPYNGYISLPSDAAKGTFTQQYTVTDRTANTTLNYEAKFQVK